LQPQAFSTGIRKKFVPVENGLFEPQPVPNNDDDESEMDDYFDDILV